MPEVEKVWTPARAPEVERALRKAWLETWDDEAGEDIVRLLLALWDLETAGGQRMHNYNLGHIIAVSEDEDYWIGDDSGNQRKFRAWPHLDAGASGLVQQLTSDTRPEWHAGLRTGDPHEFVSALKGRNGGAQYFEADYNAYLSAFLGRWEKYGADTPPAKTVSEGDHGTQVMLAQALLNASLPAWVHPMLVDGAFGGITDDRTRVFQRLSQMKVDGIVGPETWRRLLWVGGHHGILKAS